jgi:hypothetical protein
MILVFISNVLHFFGHILYHWQITYGYNVKGVNYGSQIIIFLVI